MLMIFSESFEAFNIFSYICLSEVWLMMYLGINLFVFILFKIVEFLE